MYGHLNGFRHISTSVDRYHFNVPGKCIPQAYDGQSIGIYRSLILSDDVFVSLVSRFDIE